MSIVSIMGICAGVCTSSSFFPQALKTIRTKDTTSISLLMYFIYTMGVLLWIAYGIMQNDIAVWLTNAVSFIPSFIILYMKVTEHNRTK